jgi:3-oxoacyl-[acyl-carrier protein] reductase
VTLQRDFAVAQATWAGLSARRGIVLAGAASAVTDAVVARLTAAACPVVLSAAVATTPRTGTLAATVDTAREDDVELLFDRALEHMDEVGALVVVCAAAAHGSLLDVSAVEWRDALARGLRAPFLLARRAVEEFLATGHGGRIVLVAPAPTGPTAAAAAAGLPGLCRSLTKEVGRRQITCNVVAPGDEACDVEIGDAVAFLLSGAASFVCGETIRVRAGRS